jgi:hypothetical protein
MHFSPLTNHLGEQASAVQQAKRLRKKRNTASKGSRRDSVKQPFVKDHLPPTMSALCICVNQDVKEVRGRMLTAAMRKGCNYILFE